MELNEFVNNYSVAECDDVDKVILLAYYHMRKDGITKFSLSDIKLWCDEAHLTNPNPSRLKKKINANNGFIRDNKFESIHFHAKLIEKLQKNLPELTTKSLEVKSDGNILPDSLLNGKRAYIQRFGKQINSAYSNNIFDACAVLMRRMVEICLIHTYENLGLESQIESSPGYYKDLKEIIKQAVNNQTLKLTKDSKDCLDEFRELGNLSAHKLFYNCTVEEINKVKKDFRLLIEELFNKAGSKVEK